MKTKLANGKETEETQNAPRKKQTNAEGTRKGSSGTKAETQEKTESQKTETL